MMRMLDDTKPRERNRSWKIPTTLAVIACIAGVPSWAGAAVINVPADAATIGAAITAASNGDTIVVSAGTYTENLTLDKDVSLEGAQAGVAACGRDGMGETIIDASGGVGISLKTGVAGATIDGFTIIDATRAIESFSGPIDGVTIQNNRLPDYTGVGIFLNDKGDDITVHQNAIDGSAGGGAVGIHMDTDPMDGMHITDNCVSNNSNSGVFSDSTRAVGMSASRSPLLSGNLLSKNGAGANLGRKSWEDATISDNVFAENTFDGLQGGPASSTITGNVFTKNLRVGLRLTGFGGTADSTRGAQGNDIHSNCIVDNGGGMGASYPYSGGLRYDAQFAGTQASNMTNGNNIYGNVTTGASSASADTVDAEDNWWGASDGPSGPDGSGSGDSVAGTGGGGSIDFTPYETSKLALPCNDYFPPTYSCDGFEPPMNLAYLPPAMGGGPIGRRVKNNRVLPFKAQLIDENGDPVTALVSPPVIQVIYTDLMMASSDVTPDALTAGKRSDGNEFVLAGDKWAFNLWTKNYSAVGTYTGTMQSGDTNEYVIDPTCEGIFVIEP